MHSVFTQTLACDVTRCFSLLWDTPKKRRKHAEHEDTDRHTHSKDIIGIGVGCVYVKEGNIQTTETGLKTHARVSWHTPLFRSVKKTRKKLINEFCENHELSDTICAELMCVYTTRARQKLKNENGRTFISR